MCYEHVSRLYLLTYSVKMQVQCMLSTSQCILHLLSCFLNLTKNSKNLHAACGIFYHMMNLQTWVFKSCSFDQFDMYPLLV